MLEIRSQLAVAGFERTNVTLSDAGLPQREYGALVSANLFGVEPLVGRPFNDEDEKPGAPPVAAICERVWRARYAADPNGLGRIIRLDAQAVAVIAAMPEDAVAPLVAAAVRRE